MFPACALFAAARKEGHGVSMVTDSRGEIFCADISPKIVLNTVRFSHKKIFSIMLDFASTFLKFFRLWRRGSPDVIVGFGGILTVIPPLVGKIFGSKVVIYEQNSVVGKANKFLEKFADLKLSTFELGNEWMKIAAPVRTEFCKWVLPYRCDGKINILVLGGSQGAVSFAKIIPEALSLVDVRKRKSIEITQQVGKNDLEKLRNFYGNIGIKSTLEEFIRNVAEVMAKAQLVICRSGASTLSELAMLGRPAILIPYPNSSRDHQLHNAIYYKNKKAAWVLEEKDGIALELAEIIQKVLQNRELLKSAAYNMMKSSTDRAANDFVKLIEKVHLEG
jgi:UDP-N-acetylglucosamine--N-acetylmuramyl-(pentapeptide) pyrophosphoryl-undecaprenol N-acetylglucosamine transferase